MASSLIMVVLRSLSSPRVKPLVLAYSVRLMYSAPIFWASCLAVVVLPVHGVPVMRMTRFMTVFGCVVVVIGFGFCFFACAVGFSRISPSSLMLLFGFSPLAICFT